MAAAVWSSRPSAEQAAAQAAAVAAAQAALEQAADSLAVQAAQEALQAAQQGSAGWQAVLECLGSECTAGSGSSRWASSGRAEAGGADSFAALESRLSRRALQVLTATGNALALGLLLCPPPHLRAPAPASAALAAGQQQQQQQQLPSVVSSSSPLLSLAAVAPAAGTGLLLTAATALLEAQAVLRGQGSGPEDLRVSGQQQFERRAHSRKKSQVGATHSHAHFHLHDLAALH
jgi:hypothetical protein